MVNTRRDFGPETMRGLAGAVIMVAFCTADYGEKTRGVYETYSELRHAMENWQEITLIPVKMCKKWPPSPPGQEGKDLCKMVFGHSRIVIEGLRTDEDGICLFKPAKDLAIEILDHIQELGLLHEVASRYIPANRSLQALRSAEEILNHIEELGVMDEILSLHKSGALSLLAARTADKCTQTEKGFDMAVDVGEHKSLDADPPRSLIVRRRSGKPTIASENIPRVHILRRSRAGASPASEAALPGEISDVFEDVPYGRWFASVSHDRSSERSRFLEGRDIR